MKKKLLALTLALALTLSVPAGAAGMGEKFPNIKTYSGFSDVAPESWALPYIKTCYEAGLMQGTGGTLFHPGGEMQLSEAAAIAARIGSTLSGTAIPQVEGDWYAGSVQYMQNLAAQAKQTYVAELLATPTIRATRQNFFSLLALVAPAAALPVKNSITSLPDTSDASVLGFYNAGVLSGVNSYGTFAGAMGLTRDQAAAMVGRIIRPELATAFTLTVPDFSSEAFDLTAYLSGLPAATPYLAGEGFTVNLGTYLAYYFAAADKLMALCAEQNIAFNWHNTISDVPFTTHAATQANTDVAADVWRQAHAGDDTSALLGAKHILIQASAADSAAALKKTQDLRSQLTAAGDTAAKFDELMALYSEDGRSADGTLNAPDGYTFGPGEMVAEFETGTKALQIGEISAPIQSQFGYHLILRLAPNVEDYQNTLINNWLSTLKLYASEAAENVDMTALYDNYQQLLAQ